MAEKRMVTGRLGWMLTVALLATSLAWVAALDLVLVTREVLRQWPEAAVFARVAVRATVLVAREVAPLLATLLVAALAAPALFASLAAMRRVDGGRRVNHV